MFVFSIVVRTTSKPLIICSNWQKFIGDYPEELFIEEPAKAAIEVFQRKLKGISAEIKARNAKLRVPYPYLLPERIPNSIAIWASKEKENSPLSLVERRSMLWLDKIDKIDLLIVDTNLQLWKESLSGTYSMHIFHTIFASRSSLSLLLKVANICVRCEILALCRSSWVIINYTSPGINLYTVDSTVCLVNSCPLDSVLSFG